MHMCVWMSVLCDVSVVVCVVSDVEIMCVVWDVCDMFVCVFVCVCAYAVCDVCAMHRV